MSGNASVLVPSLPTQLHSLLQTCARHVGFFLSTGRPWNFFLSKMENLVCKALGVPDNE